MRSASIIAVALTGLSVGALAPPTVASEITQQAEQANMHTILLAQNRDSAPQQGQQDNRPERPANRGQQTQSNERQGDQSQRGQAERERGQSQQGQQNERSGERNQPGQREQRGQDRQQGQRNEPAADRNQQGQREDGPRQGQRDQGTDRNQQGQREQRGPDRNQPAQSTQPAQDQNQQGQRTQPEPDRARQGQQPSDQAREPGRADPPSGRTGDRTQPSQTQQGQTTDPASSRTQQQGQSTSQSGAISNLPDERRTQIRQTLTRQNVRAATDVNISVSVGTTLPPRVEVHRVPPEIVQVVPQYRGYEYTVVRDEIVILEPGTRRIVEVLPRDGGAPSRSGGDVVRLSAEQRTAVISELRSSGRRTTGGSEALPSCVELSEVPQSLISRMPELRGYRYLSIGEEIVLVDPESRKVSVVNQ